MSGRLSFTSYPGASSSPARPSPEEVAHGDKQAHHREYDEHDLVDMLLAGRQTAQNVRYPEDGIVPGPTVHDVCTQSRLS